jgi:hypothetical protein
MGRLLEPSDLRSIIEDHGYKPGWTFDAYLGAHEGVHLAIAAHFPDTYGNGDIDVQVERFVPRVARRDADHFLDWLLEQCERIEVHEAREFFRYKGELVSDPHAPFAERDLK